MITVLNLLRQNTTILGTFTSIFIAYSISNVCRKEGSSEIIKTAKPKKTVMSVNSDMVHTERATTSSNILSDGLPASW